MRIRFIASVLIVWSILPSASRADVKEISVIVKGVTCPVCTHSINIGLRSVSGVKTVKIALATRVQVEVTAQSHTWIDPARIVRQIALVGFQANADELKLRLEGDASVRDGELLLTLSDVAPAPVRLLLIPEDQDGSRPQGIAETLAALKSGLSSTDPHAERVQIEGWWRPSTDRERPATLLVTEIAVTSEIPLANGKALAH